MELENRIATIGALVTICDQDKNGLGSKPQTIKQLELKIKQLNKKIDSLDRQEQDESLLDSLLTYLDDLTLELVAAECMWHQELTSTDVHKALFCSKC